MAKMEPIDSDVSRRQRQIIDALCEIGEASAEDVRAHMHNPPSNSAVRATLKTMEERGLVARRECNFKYLYSVVAGKDEIRKSAMERLVRTFFDNSAEHAALALLGASEQKMTPKQIERIRKAIEDAKQMS